jgi:deazaflavin-dependent oxidoreductase (nitroreductase family)
VNAKLTTTGRKTGQLRSVTLYAYPDGDRLVVVGSRGGAKADPAWALNLRADPRATITIGKDDRAVRAKEVIGKERERLWRLVTEAFPLYATYQRRTERRIPLFVLSTDSARR